MPRYRVRVQLIHWYEVVVMTDSAESALEHAEALSPKQILARGKRARSEAGLADPASVEIIEDK